MSRNASITPQKDDFKIKELSESRELELQSQISTAAEPFVFSIPVMLEEKKTVLLYLIQNLRLANAGQVEFIVSLSDDSAATLLAKKHGQERNDLYARKVLDLCVQILEKKHGVTVWFPSIGKSDDTATHLIFPIGKFIELGGIQFDGPEGDNMMGHIFLKLMHDAVIQRVQKIMASTSLIKFPPFFNGLYARVTAEVGPMPDGFKRSSHHRTRLFRSHRKCPVLPIAPDFHPPSPQ